MTINQIFDIVQYGEEKAKEKALSEEVHNFYDKDLALFYASKRIKKLSGNVVMTESEEQKVNRITSKIESIEDRLEEGKVMSTAYKKMQAAAIMEDCKSLSDEAGKTRKFDSNKAKTFGKMIATAKYFVENNIDDKVVLKEGTNLVLNKAEKDEEKMLNNIELGE